MYETKVDVGACEEKLPSASPSVNGIELEKRLRE
jgi:hypothetical protein